ncbi:Gfo/Idh/MocA family protein [Maritalea mediterranea]|uniref:Gfo/Idh/MocA family oxidoreductase n=1 Tax=Maritalea mediterranea TaxID=2909667 RepID=A0ABS9E486_9HYPH|nr:Gfo/Idh/MocA family oxidoreductase [Maritalea mediterranea]MCF4097603.1 Gfo/Idh/MocA family oxidoreductase [Maritalea mediterranea]
MQKAPAKMRIGMLGAAAIAHEALVKPARRRDDVTLVAVAARDFDKAKNYAAEYGFQEAVDGYDALIARDDIDLIYNPLIPSRHMDLSCAAMRAGKHVLVEKPFALNIEQTKQMLDCARETGQHLIEAFHHRYHPLFAHLLELIQAGKFGTIKRFRAQFDVPIPQAQSPFRHQLDLGGGALMDLGCYPVHWAQTLLKHPLKLQRANARLTPRGVDEEISAQFTSGDTEVELGCNMADEVNEVAYLQLDGTKGRLFVQNPIAPHSGHFIETEIDGVHRKYTLGGNTTYDYQLDATIQAIRSDTPALTGGEDSRVTMQLMQDIYEAVGIDRRFSS